MNIVITNLVWLGTRTKEWGDDLLRLSAEFCKVDFNEMTEKHTKVNW